MDLNLHILRFRSSAGVTAALASVLLALGSAAALGAQPRHLFLEPSFVTEAEGAKLVVNPPVSREVVIRADRPWEAFMITFYLTVIEEDGKLRMWYVCRDADKTPNLAYAESSDGVTWTKPNLGVVDYKGSRDNNLVGVASLEGTVFKDPHARSPDETYVYVSTVFKGGGIYRFTSPDGYRWRRDEKPLLPFEADSQNVTFRDERLGRYVLYLRGWDVSKPFGLGRKVVRLELDRLDRATDIVPSKDNERYPKDPTRDHFIIDELPTVLARDELDPPVTDIYTNAIQPYPIDPSWYVGFPALYRHHTQSAYRNDGWTEIQFIGSRDGVRWQRYDRESYLRPGPDGGDDGSMLYVGPGMVVRGDEIWQYGTGYRTTHGDVPGREKKGDGTIYRYVQRLDGFVSLDFEWGGGRALCAPIRVTGSTLVLNVDTGGLGDLRVGLRDAAGGELPGFTADDCDLIRLNSTKAIITWKGRGDLASLLGREVQVELLGARTKVYSLRFVP